MHICSFKFAGPSAQRRVGIHCPIPAVSLQKRFMGKPATGTAHLVLHKSPLGDPWALHGSIRFDFSSMFSDLFLID